ncbi:hypothetical protein ABT112_26760 [Streptomyces sp. NPDC002055]|uniref:hypothetical protein n=1 Tax=Streptomyces sp. NPDC002055 TaxID=3154534 RepID=UPI003324BA7B
MHAKPSTTVQNVATQITFTRGDYVLYRDPALFWAGRPGHTYVCRVVRAERNTDGHWYTLDPVTGGGRVYAARGDYMRLLPPADAMRDIDTAPLSAEGAAQEMTPAATAWLTQHHATANRRPELPAQRH